MTDPDEPRPVPDPYLLGMLQRANKEILALEGRIRRLRDSLQEAQAGRARAIRQLEELQRSLA